MKKLLTILILLLAVVTRGWADISLGVNTVWTGSEKISWNTEVVEGTQFESTNGTFTGLLVGDKIVVTSTLTEGYSSDPQYVLTYKAGNSWEWTDLTTSIESGTINYTVASEQIATEIAQRGLIFRGQGYTITKIEVVRGHKITITSPANGTIMAKNGEDDVKSGDYVLDNTSLALTATPAEGYSFSKWVIGDAESTENPHTITVTEATSIAATFAANAIPAFSLDGFSADDGNSYDATTHSLTTAAGWSGMQLWIGDNSTYSGSKLVVKTAEDCKLKITVGYVGEGEAELSDEAAGKNHAVTLDNTKKIQKVIIQNQEAGTVTFSSMELDPSYTLTISSAENGSLTVNDGTNNLASGASVAYGTTLTLTATPAEGYSFSKWVIGDAESTENPHTITVTEATSIAATFAANAIPAFSLDGFSADDGNSYDATTHSLTTAVGWSGMQLWIGDNSTYSGSKLVVKTAEDCKLKITVGYVGEGEAELSDEATGKNHAVTLDNTKKIQKVIIQNQEAGTVTFSSMELDPSYTLTISSAENGSLTVNDGTNNLASGASVAYGTTLTLTATPADDYSFAKWTIGGEESTENPHTLTITEAISIAATFTANAIPAFSLDGFSADDGNSYDATTHSLTTAVGWSGMQLWIGDNSTYSGSKLVVKTAEDCKLKITVGYVGEGEAELSDEATGKNHAVTLDNTKKIQKVIIQNQEAGTVTFSSMELDPSYTLTISSAENGSLTVNDGTNNLASGASVAYGTTLTLTATPAEGYSFSKWVIGDAESTENPHTITVTEATSIAATFAANAIPAFSLDGFSADDGNSYDATTHSLTTAVGWSGMQLWIGDNSTYSGSKLVVKTAEDCKLKITVGYVGEGEAELSEEAAGKSHAVTLDNTKKIQKVIIQNQEAGTVTFSSMELDPEEPILYTLTVKQPEMGGTIKIEDNAAETAQYESGTELTLTATASEGYSFTKWTIGKEESTENPLILTMTADKTVSAVFTANTPEKTGVNISLTELNEGWNSTYDAATKTITTTGEWAARGWYVGDNRYNGKGSITVKFNAVEFPVTLKMEYTNTNDESRSVEAGAAAGETEVVLDIPDNVKTIEKVYITYQPAGTLALTEATVNDKVVDNRTEKTLVENTQAISDGDIKVNRGMFSNAVAGDIIRIYGIPGEGAKIALEPADYSGAFDAANWTTFEESPFALKLTETVLNTIKEKGLLVRGENYTFTKAVLYTETALGNEIEDEEPEPEPQEPDEPTKTGIDISLGGMNEGWSSTYDASTKTITTEGEWGARGWYIGDDRYNGKGSITVKFNAVEFPVTLKMEYTNTNDESRSVEAGAAAGETEVVLDIPENVKTIDKVYITYQPVGTLALTEATVNDKVVDNRTEKTLVENTQAIADGDVRINRGLFANAVAGDIIRIYGIPGEGAKIALEPADYSGAFDAANWTTFEESPFALKLTETVLNTIKEKDLLVRGENYTFNKAVLYTENELGEAIADATKYTLNLTSPENGTVTIKQGEDTVEPGEFEENTELTLTAEAAEGYLFTKWIMNGEDAGREATLAVKMTANVTITAVFDQKPVTIIDEKTGEVNLSEMTAQDVEAATVTVNTDDHSITITTTQPYKAAQIWFNKPEEVRGNVLMVNIAEQDANVTVTVKYTDGTESSMTSTTTGAQSATARRTSTAGAQIVVPVDMGKKLQCIELKNALAGTLHVTKMVFTTQNVFTDGKANLSMAKAQSNATYDIATYTLATTKGWTGLTLTPLESEDVKGVELMVRFHDDAQVKLQVVYVDGTELSTIMDKPGRYVKMTLDKSKDIREVTIQPTMAGVIQLTELSVNQTPTPDEIPAPVFTNGKADLSRLTVQDASRVMYNTETCKMATTDGWIGVELNTTEAENVSGAELAVRFTEAVKVKVAVVYNDGSQSDTIPEVPMEETRLLLDPTKSVRQIQIQPTEAGALQFVEIVVRQTVTPEPEPVYFFNKEGVADLSQLLPMGSNATFNETNHQLTTTENWAGIQAWLENPQAVDGNVLSVKLAEENVNIKISVGYTDGTESTADGADTNATETGTEILVPNDATKEIQKVMIQMPEAGTVTLLSISSINFSVTELTEGENRLLWKNSQGAKLSWNNICKKDALYGAILKEGQQLLVTVSSRDENNEWPKIFVRDANDQETGQVVELNSLRHYPYVVRITLTDEMVNQMADGFAICGDGVTVTSVYLYQPLPPQPGDINLIELNGGWNSTYDAERHIITTTSRWGACGWNIGDDRYNGMNLIQIGFEAVDFPVTLKMEYVDANGKKQATSAGIAAGRTTVELEIPEGIRQIDKVYLIWQQPGSVTLTSAEVSSTKAEALGIDLALFDPMGEKVSYDKQTYTMTTEEGYAGIQLWLGDANAIESPMLLELKTAGETAKLRVTVGYTDGTEASVDGEGANIQMELDDLRSIQKIMIQNMEAGTVTFNSLNITVRMPNGANAPAWDYIPVSGEGTYTVNGTKVSALTKGLYIMDGKKIVIK